MHLKLLWAIQELLIMSRRDASVKQGIFILSEAASTICSSITVTPFRTKSLNFWPALRFPTKLLAYHRMWWARKLLHFHINHCWFLSYISLSVRLVSGFVLISIIWWVKDMDCDISFRRCKPLLLYGHKRHQRLPIPRLRQNLPIPNPEQVRLPSLIIVIDFDSLVSRRLVPQMLLLLYLYA